MKVPSGVAELRVPLESTLRGSLATSLVPDERSSVLQGRRRGSASSLCYSQEGGEPWPEATFSVQQSAPLPSWLWLVLARVLRVPLPDRPRCPWVPTLGLLLQVLTLCSGLGMVVSETWYSVIESKHDVQGQSLHRGVGVVLVLAWCLFGLYGRRLARRLFSHPAFLKDIRMHSKTLLKVNVAALVALAGGLFVGVHSYMAWPAVHYSDFPKGLSEARFALRLLFSLLSLFWNSLVCVILVSVARTHTIGIRRFIRELEADAVVYEKRYSNKYPGSVITSEDILQESVWIGEEFSDDEEGTFQQEVHLGAPAVIQSSNSTAGTEGRVNSVTSHVPHVLTNGEILRTYWKISCRLRLSGIALQRWVASLLGMVVAWSSSLLVIWLSHPATLWELLEFVAPLTVVLVICTSFAEVNVEGTRMLKCIRPTEDRLQMMNFIMKSPLQLLTFGFALTYGTIMTVVLGVLVAFTSRLIIVEIEGH